MRIDFKNFRTKLAWRFFLMFIACALIPITALVGVSYFRVTRQLEHQAFDRLNQTAKSHTLSIYQNLLLADHQLQLVKALLGEDSKPDFTSLPAVIFEKSREMFSEMLIVTKGEIVSSWKIETGVNLLDSISTLDELNSNTVLLTFGHEKLRSSVVLSYPISTSGDTKTYLVGVIKNAFLWGLESGNILPPETNFYVWDDQGNTLFSSFNTPVVLERPLSSLRDGMLKGSTELKIEDQSYYAAYWSAFLKPRFYVPSWTVMVMQPSNYVLQPLQYFRMIFIAAILFTFLLVIWLSSQTIRRSLNPIDALMVGVGHVAKRHFSHRVHVESNDEFQNLAEAFNQMADQLEIQFRTIEARSDVDRAILSVMDIDHIVTTCLNRSNLLIPFKTLAISIIEAEDPWRGRSYLRVEDISNPQIEVKPFSLGSEGFERICQQDRWLQIEKDENTPNFLKAILNPDIRYFYIFPIWVWNHLYAFISVGIMEGAPYSQKDLEQVRGVADHLAVGFTNSNLISSLKELSTGTIYALARTVDAKSSWTAGHSVRVAKIALNIATTMRLGPNKLELLQRAALLHDIGKIGVPISILDKEGKLTAEEYDLIKSHCSAGARILSPIRAFQTIIPIVEQHHERFDGKGYPFGYSGNQIHQLARILSVADTYDALVSDRPYRKGLDGVSTSRIIQSESGHQFDPHVVVAFKQVICHMGYDQIQQSAQELGPLAPLDPYIFPVNGTYDLFAEEL